TSVIIKIGPPQISILKFNAGYRLLLFLYGVGVVIYTLQNGIALGLSYNDRLTANTGGGISIILMYAYIPAMILAYINMPTRKNLFLCLCLSTLCGVVYYIVIGGSRNV
ncbi:TPA: WzyE family oligosaccharide polymerase, partial [Enterobacter hormaechei subsp. steigerwaltii]|nr:WzyE family oligosaccharide polymerase [Enterobacter hormaechei subsp. steigerwaltii]